MKQIEDIVDRILDGADQERNQSNIADTASETVVIDIDEIMDIFGAPMVYHEIVSKSKGLGSLSFIYTRLVHPVIAALFNSGVSEDQEETEKFLEALRTEEQHPLRLWLRDKAEELLLELEASPDQAQRMEAWKEELFQAVPVQEVLLQLLRLLRSPVGPKAELEALLGEPGRDISLRTPLVSWVLTQLMGYWDYFKKNQSLRLLLEGSCKEALSHLLAGHRHLIGEVAVHALDRLSAERLNRLVEEKVGEDLAWIRINGSLVGGIIGFCLFWMLEALR